MAGIERIEDDPEVDAKDPTFKNYWDALEYRSPEEIVEATKARPVLDLAFILIGGLMGVGILFTIGVGVWTIALWIGNLFTRT